MAQEASNHLLSYADYLAIDDDRRYEVIEGTLTPMTPSPRLAHQRAAAYLWRLLDDHAHHAGGQAVIAPFDVILEPERPAVVLQPDVLFVTAGRAGVVTAAGVMGPPDLVIEVASPSSARIDAITKRRLYAAHGVREYWLVSIDAEQIQVYRLEGLDAYGKPSLLEPGDQLVSALLPGFSLDVRTLFERANGT